MAEYYVPARDSETEFTEKRSRFIGHVWRVEQEEEAREKIAQMKAKHYDARHNCWCYLIREGGRRRILLSRVGKHTQPFKFHLVHKFFQLFMVFLCLSRETCDQSCTENDIRNLFAEFTDDIDQFLFRCAASHSLKNTVRRMLDRNVQIMADLFLIADRLDQLIVDLLRITVENTDPADSFDLTEFLKENVKRFFAIEIFAIYGCFLCYQDQLFHTLLCHILCLRDQTLHRNAAEFSAKLRDDTVGAVLITAFCDLQVSEMSSCCKNTFASCVRKIIDITEFFEMIACHSFLQSFYDVSIGGGSENSIYLRNFFDNLFLVTLRHTACHDQCVTAS